MLFEVLSFVRIAPAMWFWMRQRTFTLYRPPNLDIIEKFENSTSKIIVQVIYTLYMKKRIDLKQIPSVRHSSHKSNLNLVSKQPLVVSHIKTPFSTLYKKLMLLTSIFKRNLWFCTLSNSLTKWRWTLTRVLPDPATESTSVAGSHKRSRKFSLTYAMVSLFSNSGPIRFWNSFTDTLSTITEEREFHKEITLWEKKYFLVLRRTLFFTGRMWCLLVLPKLVLNSRSDGRSSKPCLFISKERRFFVSADHAVGWLDL